MYSEFENLHLDDEWDTHTSSKNDEANGSKCDLEFDNHLTPIACFTS